MGKIRTNKLKIFAEGTMQSVVHDFKKREREEVGEKRRKREKKTGLKNCKEGGQGT